MTALRIARWEAWSPGLADTAAWSAWAREPRALACEGAPDLRFMPPLERRRCDQLSRMMLDVAHRCSSDTAADALPCVFASRHGSICTTAELLEQLALDAQISPASFSHSVHNTQLGLFSIFARNPAPRCQSPPRTAPSRTASSRPRACSTASAAGPCCS